MQETRYAGTVNAPDFPRDLEWLNAERPLSLTTLFYVIARLRWRWPVWQAAPLAGAFLAIDLAFFGANLTKVARGGWVPLAIAAAVYLVMSTWNRGTALLTGLLSRSAVPLDRFLEDLERTKPPRVPGTAVFLTPNIEGAPAILVYHLSHNKALHEEVILLSIITQEVPEVPPEERISTEALPQGFYRVRAYYGFVQTPDVEEIVALCCDRSMKADPEQTTYYLGRARLLPTATSPMMRWRKFASVETIKSFRLIEQALDPEDEELTPTMKLERALVNVKYKSLIDSMYQGSWEFVTISQRRRASLVVRRAPRSEHRRP